LEKSLIKNQRDDMIDRCNGRGSMVEFKLPGHENECNRPELLKYLKCLLKK